MKELFLYYLWGNRLLSNDLKTVDGNEVEVFNPGFRNLDSGPDFLEAKIKMDGKLWAGHVEIHVKTSDWNRHGHQYDKTYHNVVLHVVYEHDTRVNDIPVLELKGRFDDRLFNDYQRFVSAKSWIPCERSIGQVQAFTLVSWLDRMAIERLEQKSEKVTKMLKANQFDWEDTLYRLLMRYFGMKVNNEAFEYLANLLPFKTLLKHADQLTQLEAMLFGCAGFLEGDFEEAYHLLLKREFNVMRAKFGLLTMPVERWKFMRMRPVNFPTVRLAQIAQMIHRHGCLFSKIKETEDVEAVKALFDVKASAYWDRHYRFGEPTSQGSAKPKRLGDSMANVLVINTVSPLLFCYGKLHKELSFCEKALSFLEKLPTEDNSIIRHFTQCGVHAEHAMHTQGLLHSYSMYCKRKRCLECPIGNAMLRN